jgi:hypothetical protein
MTVIAWHDLPPPPTHLLVHSHERITGQAYERRREAEEADEDDDGWWDETVEYDEEDDQPHLLFCLQVCFRG